MKGGDLMEMNTIILLVIAVELALVIVRLGKRQSQ